MSKKVKIDRITPRGFKGIWIPKEIFFCEDLSWEEKMLILEIDSLDKNGSGCFASNKYLAGFIGKSEGGTANIISELRTRGYIEDKGFDGRERRIGIKADLINALRQSSPIGEGRVNEMVGIYNDEVIKNNNKIEVTPSENTEKKRKSKISFSDIEERRENEDKFKSLTKPEELEVLEVFQKNIFSGCSASAKTIVAGIPRAINIFRTYFKEEAVSKLKEALVKLKSDETFKWQKGQSITMVSPKIIFSESYVSNNLIPLITNQNGDLCKRPETEEELRRIKEDNKRRTDEFFRKREERHKKANTN
jgi:hypothetical protein